MSWKILRVLTTNKCNYRCLYCHNEGQSFSSTQKCLSFKKFIDVLQNIGDTGISEIRFSGGEPLLNEYTVDMIEWTDNNTNYEIGLATNGSMMTESLAIRLSNTRVMVTLHLAALNPKNYSNITGGDIRKLKQCIELFEKYNIRYSFNHVLYPKTICNLEETINYSVSHSKQLKLLPYIERGCKNASSEIIQQIEDKINKYDYKKVYDNTSGITWLNFPNGAVIKIIDSSCYSKDISKCRNYAEIRLLPDTCLQSCIFGKPIVLPRVSDISKKMEELWEKFNVCPKV